MAHLKYKPFMAYIEPAMQTALRKFAKKKRTTMTEVIREALNARLTPGDPYVAGFNNGIDAAVAAVKNTKAAQMRFPSGKTFAEIISDEVERHYLQENTDGTRGREESMPKLPALLSQ